uniref:Uncharacterized protein n=1 Tax=Anguilla anguilla TaxID=7936 RepID=A0A0E9P6H0_ANGAN
MLCSSSNTFLWPCQKVMYEYLSEVFFKW